MTNVVYVDVVARRRSRPRARKTRLSMVLRYCPVASATNCAVCAEPIWKGEHAWIASCGGAFCFRCWSDGDAFARSVEAINAEAQP